ncbi:MAG: hypothetical protein U0L79_09870 [Lachnospiraceae bacterium]|nr:hypothetical protein [Lachnospiraceae bacterium]
MDTYKLDDYAQRIYAVNRRIRNLDERLDSLYWKVGWTDLWSLMSADMLVGNSRTLRRCASYLEDTAIEFLDIESKIASVLI